MTGVDLDRAAERLERRSHVFHEQTGPLLDFYRNRGTLVTVDAARPPDEVTAAMLEAVKPRGE